MTQRGMKTKPTKVAFYKCNLCGEVMQRKTLRVRQWLPSYCDKALKSGRLYRISITNEVK